MSQKYVYLFNEGNASMRNLLGGKGANLAEMIGMGLPVPEGFTVTTESCMRYYEDGQVLSDDIISQIYAAMEKLEQVSGKKFGDKENPFLVSVRSGARVSMPGMMDTVLNLGLNDDTVEGLAVLTNNERFAYDCYLRFIQMFSDVVMGIERSKFDAVLNEIKEKYSKESNEELTAEHLKEAAKKYKELYKQEKGMEFPQEPKEQLIEAVKAVFRSWNNPRAIVYRRMNDIPGNWGTAVNVQLMVFGNLGNDSGTGVAFTRNPSTGEKELYGEFLMNAQGEDVVAGIRTPNPISDLQKTNPEVYDQFVNIAKRLELHYRDMQDMEFTIERGKLYILQTRNGKRTAQAAVKIAVDLVSEGLLTKEEAIMKVEPKQLETLIHPSFKPEALKKAKPIAKGLPASPGAAVGSIYFSAEKAKAAADRGEKVVLVREETSPEDIEGMYASEGILTSRGGMTSHAAVVARSIGTCCVAGCSAVSVNEKAGTLTVNGVTYKEGDIISLDGSTGYVYGEVISTQEPAVTGYFKTIMDWADEIRDLKIRTNADSPKDAKQAVEFGAEGIGLCRTEHMFFDAERIPAFQKMIVASSPQERRKALDQILPMQKEDFKGVYEVMKDRPVTIRLLDPPLHEFLPHEDADIEKLSSELGISFERLKGVVANLKELNPMLGHRGCRLAVSYPEIAEMQTRAIIEAALEVKKEKGYDIVPEIMIPLVCELKELQYVKNTIVDTANKMIEESGVELKYLVGTMIEIPRAALTADEIAKEAEFFSFGTNDLTQMTYGLSRDDAGRILEDYYEAGIFEADLTAKLDRTGVGKLMQIAVELGRKTRPDIKLGICGEHGGDPDSIEFCHMLGLDYVSCSPYRVPIARLAAAQAKIKHSK
ncbi:MAG: pyruvate, phosphate dikinase [Clostridiales bacterium]|nr:pyruvate, phosphate dikinase [Clostridiales bacterium]